MNILILGAPGSGKGTQGKILAEKFGLYYFEGGDFSRQLAKKDKRISQIVAKGELIPESEMTAYVVDFLDKTVPSGKNILFDGYPRFVGQYVSLKNWLVGKGTKLDKALFLEISDEVVIRRLSTRRICKKCGSTYNLFTKLSETENVCDKCGGTLMQRNDDQPEIIKERLNEYKNNVEPLIEYLDKEGILLKINGEKPITEITQNIIAELNKEGVNA